jgi:hypothetical protein
MMESITGKEGDTVSVRCKPGYHGSGDTTCTAGAFTAVTCAARTCTDSDGAGAPADCGTGAACSEVDAAEGGFTCACAAGYSGTPRWMQQVVPMDHSNHSIAYNHVDPVAPPLAMRGRANRSNFLTHLSTMICISQAQCAALPLPLAMDPNWQMCADHVRTSVVQISAEGAGGPDGTTTYRLFAWLPPAFQVIQ